MKKNYSSSTQYSITMCSTVHMTINSLNSAAEQQQQFRDETSCGRYRPRRRLISFCGLGWIILRCRAAASSEGPMDGEGACSPAPAPPPSTTTTHGFFFSPPTRSEARACARACGAGKDVRRSCTETCIPQRVPGTVWHMWTRIIVTWSDLHQRSRQPASQPATQAHAGIISQ